MTLRTLADGAISSRLDRVSNQSKSLNRGPTYKATGLIHRSVPWPLPGHPEAMKMETPQGYFHTSCKFASNGVLRSSHSPGLTRPSRSTLRHGIPGRKDWGYLHVAWCWMGCPSSSTYEISSLDRDYLLAAFWITIATIPKKAPQIALTTMPPTRPAVSSGGMDAVSSGLHVKNVCKKTAIATPITA
jgi:hypothetical protein